MNLYPKISITILAQFWVRIISYSSHLILSFFLAKSDFALLAVIATIHLFVVGFKDFGTFQYLLTTKNYNNESYYVLLTNYCLNLVAFILVCFLAYLFSEYYSDWRLLPLIIGINFLQFFATYTSVIKLNLYKKNDFKSIGKIETISNFIGIVILAFSLINDANIFSYLFSQIGIALSSLYLYSLKKNKLLKKKYNLKIFKKYLFKIKWLVLNRYVESLSLYGFYITLIFSISQSSLGIFYFGIKIYEILAVYLGNILNQITIPFFLKAKKANKEQYLFFKFSKIMSFLVGYLSLIIIFIAPMLINEAWSSKWNQSIDIFIIILAVFPIALLGTTFSRSYIEYKRKFKSIFFIKLFECVFLIIITFIGIHYNGMLGAAIAISFSKLVFSIFQYIKASKLLRVSLTHSLNELIKNIFPFYSIIVFFYLFNIDMYNFEINLKMQLYYSIKLMASSTLYYFFISYLIDRNLIGNLRNIFIEKSFKL